MTTLNKIVYAIKEKVGGGKVSDDETPFKRRVAYIVNNIRAFLMDEEIKKGRLEPSWFLTLYCIPIINSSYTECCIEESEGCSIKRTEKELPQIAVDSLGPILSAESTNGQHSFSLTRDFRSKFVKFSKYEKLVDQAYFRNGYLYIVTKNQLLEKLNISGVFTDPEEAGKFKSCEGKPCWDWDSKYPVPERLVEKIIDLACEILVGEKQLPQDIINDGKEDNKANPR
jgi:hypothetical protein